VAILATIVNIVLLIVFIHQIAVSIQANNVVSDIAIFISNQVRTLFPEQIGEEAEDDDNHDRAIETNAYAESMALVSPKTGYLQYIDGEAVIAQMIKHDGLLALHCRPGAHMVQGMVIGMVYSQSALEQKDADAILNRFVIGKNRIAQQDVEFSILQMVEIALRALSPGVNDPFTAIACVDNLTATMCYLTHVKFPSRYRYDDEETLRMIASIFDFETILDAAFGQIRQYAGGNPAVISRLMEALIRIDGFVTKEGHRNAVIKQAEMVLRTGRESIQEKNDLDGLIIKASEICPSLMEPSNQAIASQGERPSIPR
jgi:uncharacterized membrane protein